MRANEGEGEGEMNDGTFIVRDCDGSTTLPDCLFASLDGPVACLCDGGERLISDVHWLRTAAEPKAGIYGSC